VFLAVHLQFTHDRCTTFPGSLLCTFNSLTTGAQLSPVPFYLVSIRPLSLVKKMVCGTPRFLMLSHVSPVPCHSVATGVYFSPCFLLCTFLFHDRCTIFPSSLLFCSDRTTPTLSRNWCAVLPTSWHPLSESLSLLCQCPRSHFQSLNLIHHHQIHTYCFFAAVFPAHRWLFWCIPFPYPVPLLFNSDQCVVFSGPLLISSDWCAGPLVPCHSVATGAYLFPGDLLFAASRTCQLFCPGCLAYVCIFEAN
jgi:hypothetical protein